MLYTLHMDKKPNVPGEICLGEKEHSWRIDWQGNSWAFVAKLISAFSDIVFANVVRQWPLEMRVSVVIVEFFAVGLWVRSLVRWIRGMDEMHRRITVAAILFAISAAFFFLMLWRRLDAAG